MSGFEGKEDAQAFADPFKSYRAPVVSAVLGLISEAIVPEEQFAPPATRRGFDRVLP